MNKPHKVKAAKEEKPAPADQGLEKIKADLEAVVQEIEGIKDRLNRSPF